MSLDLDVSFLGIDELSAFLVSQRLQRAAENGAQQHAEQILRRSLPDVPVRTGVMKATGRVERPAADTWRIVYGGTSAPYTLIVHERLDVHHPHGRAKWLELAAMAEAPSAETRIVGAMRRA